VKLEHGGVSVSFGVSIFSEFWVRSGEELPLLVFDACVSESREIGSCVTVWKQKTWGGDQAEALVAAINGEYMPWLENVGQL